MNSNQYRLTQLSCGSYWLFHGMVVSVVGTHGEDRHPVVRDQSVYGKQYLVFPGGRTITVMQK